MFRKMTGIAFLFVVAFGLSVAGATAQTAPSTTALGVSSNGTPVTTVSSGSVVTLTATVQAGSTAVTVGQVNFCDASAAYCTDIHLMGTAQLTSAGAATFKFRPGIGSHSYKAVFVGTRTYAASASIAAALSVTGSYPTSTGIKSTGGPGSYSLAATVTGVDLYSPAPSGTVSFVDTSNSNAIVGTATLGSGSSALSFLNSANPATGYNPYAIVVANFNGDGIPDLAIANQQSNTVTVLLGKGDGTFTAAATLTTGSYPSALAVADFNGDGILDLAVVNNNGGYGNTSNVTVFLGKGDGTFTTVASNPSVGSGAGSIVSGDFDGDGTPDLAVANFYLNSVTILLGIGDGTFIPAPTSPPAGNGPNSIAAADFNGDGKLDLALTDLNTDTVTVLLGNGDGTFTSAASPATGIYPDSVVVADLNGDGVPDLVVSNEQSNITVLVGKGDGTFTAAPSPGFVEYVAIGDFNGDGIPDLAGTRGYETDVFLGNGDGTFATGPTYTPSPLNSETDFICLATGDFNGDGVSDLAEAGLIVYGEGPNGLSQILLSDPQSTATASASVTVGPGPHLVEASYSGDSNYGSSISTTTTLTGKPVSTALNLAVSAGPYTVGQSVTLTATLNPYTDAGYSTDGETVSFKNGTKLLGTGTLSAGVATMNFDVPTAAQYSFAAVYGGDSIFVGSSSSTIAITVPAVTTLSLSASPGPYTFGKTVTLTATLSPYTNAGFSTNSEFVSFYNSSTLLGTSTLTSGTATLTLSSLKAGGYSFNAGYAGDSNFTASNSNAVPLSVAPATPAITWPAPSAVTYGTALGSSQLNASTPVAGSFNYSPEAGTILNVGSQSLSVTFTPTDTVDYTTATATATLMVNQATPTINWITPTAISYGTALGTGQLNASSVVAGTFAYSPAAGTVLGAGLQTLTVTFTPTDTTDYKAATAIVTLMVSQATPTITWSTPTAITYGAGLGGGQLNATASVAGSFTYSPAAGTVPGAGPQTLKATFIPTDTTDYSNATASVTLMVNQATPAITWTAPAPISYGTALGSGQLNATSPVAGSFSYSPVAGTVLGVGSQTLKVTFMPSDSTDYTPATATVSLTVNQATPTITWLTPAAITYGTALGIGQLNATSAAAGAFAYSPVAGTVLDAGPQTLTAIFTPTDATDYKAATATVTLTVNQATPAITWPTPSAITYGTALSANQLNATSSVAGTFSYSPAAGTVLGEGSQILKTTFTPTDTNDYTAATATVTLMVNQATPTITWPTPTAITYGAGLGSAQLNATASVPGTFAYSPSAGTVLGAGSQTLTATFNPSDTTTYKATTATQALTVNPAAPTITWATPAPITFGTALSATQLNATASLPGTFAYNPGLGATPPVGTDTLSSTFTPTDNVDYTTATATVMLTVGPPPNPLPFLGSMTPAIADAGAAPFTLTVSGSGFLANSTVYWGTTALTTQFVSSTQLTASVTAADIATAGATAINVRTPAPGGGTSDVLQFEVDSPTGASSAPTVPTTAVVVTGGSSATYSISFPADVTSASATCLNLPVGAICTYSDTSKVLTITTASSTPAGSYQVTVVFTETVTGTTAAGILAPFLLLPLLFLRKKLRSRGILWTASLGLILVAATFLSSGCGGSSSHTSTPPTQSVTSSGVVALTVK